MKTALGFAALLSLLLVPGVGNAAPGPLAITVNGAPLALDQEPIERVGRVYVPLRGIFERLGASVVYQAGQIAATRGSTTVSLRLGSTTAYVDGRPTTLDAPPFLVGPRTLVPLRFIAESLGASVQYNDATATVAIFQRTAEAPASTTIRIVHVEPHPNTTVGGPRPEISGSFDAPVDPNTVRVRIDGRDVTRDSYISPRAFAYVPTFDLPFAEHLVEVHAAQSRRAWSFGNAPQPRPNYLNALAPPNGAHVGNGFIVNGMTRPRATVKVEAVADARVPFGEINRSSVTQIGHADARGSFAVPIAIDDQGSGAVDVRIESRSRDGVVAIRTLRLRP
jgi:hypothetical protein